MDIMEIPFEKLSRQIQVLADGIFDGDIGQVFDSVLDSSDDVVAILEK